MRNRRSVVVVAILAAAVIGGGGRHARADGAVAGRRDDRRTPNASAALTSIYAYAYDAAHPSSGRKFPTMGIVDAAKLLGDPHLTPEDTKRRRAIGVLASAGTPPTTTDGEWRPPDVQAALIAIRAPMHELTEAFVRQAQGGLPFDKQWLAYKVLSSTDGPWKQKCCACLEDWDVDPDPDPPDDVVSAYFKITVPRPRDEVRPLIDPQSWAACSPEYFHTTKVIATGDVSCAGAPLCGSGEPPFLGTPPDPHSVWKGTLFEHYQNAYAAGSPCTGLPGNHGAMYVRNVLRVEKSQNTDRDLVDYGVCRKQAAPPVVGAIDSAIDCQCEQYGVDVDCGRTQVFAKQSDASWVEGYKYLKFSKRGVDYDLKRWAAVGLRMMIDEITEEGVCCTYPGGSGTPAATSCPECPAPIVVEDPGNPDIALCTSTAPASDE